MHCGRQPKHIAGDGYSPVKKFPQQKPIVMLHHNIEIIATFFNGMVIGL